MSSYGEKGIAEEAEGAETVAEECWVAASTGIAGEEEEAGFGGGECWVAASA